MVKFREVDPTEIPNMRESHRGRVSYPILKGFLETGFLTAELDRTGMQQSYQSLYSSLSSYIRNHDMPIKLFSRKGELYLMRLDIDEEGNEIPNWREVRDLDIKPDSEEAAQAKSITSDEVASRFKEEKDKTTK